MNIVIYQWKAYQQQDIYEALCSLKHQVICYDTPLLHPEEDDDYVEQLVAFLRRHDAQILFSINYFPVLSDACEETGILYVAWTCDSPLLGLYHESVFHSCNRIFFFDKTDYHTFRSLGVKHAYYLPLGACVSRLEKSQPSAQAAYDVSFVGNLYHHNSYDEMADCLPAYLSGYLDCALEAQQQITGGSLFPHLLTDDICSRLEPLIDYQKSPRSFADIRLLFSTTVLGFKAASIGRSETILRLSQALRAHSRHVHLFTEDTDANLPFTVCHGPVDYRHTLPQIVKSSIVNLNMTIPNIQTGLPLRIWDILGCGGFVLSNFQSEIPELLQAGKELETYESQEELLEKCQFYVQHEDAAAKIARRGYETVRKAHTLQQRLAELLQTVDSTC